MSIFDNFKQNNNSYLTNTDEDLNFLTNIFKKFFDTYNDNLSENNILYFVKDMKQLLKLNNDFWEEGIKEFEEEEEEEMDEEAKKMLQKTYDMLANTSELINLLPTDQIIQEISVPQLIEFMKENNNKINLLLVKIHEFHSEVSNNMNELNNSMKKCNEQLEKTSDQLQITLICSQFSGKLKELMESKDDPKLFVEKFRWFLDKLSELENLKVDKNDKNYVYTFNILKQVISTFSNLFSDNSSS